MATWLYPPAFTETFRCDYCETDHAEDDLTEYERNKWACDACARANDEEAAKAAAQADYEARILAAIDPAPVSVREAARVLLDWTDHNVNGAGQDFADDIGTGGIAAYRAIAEGKDE